MTTRRQQELRLELQEKLSEQASRLDEQTMQLQDHVTKQQSLLRQELNTNNQEVMRSLGEQISRQQTQLYVQQEERLKTFTLENNEKMQQIYQGLGEMRNLAHGVGDLKKVLSNVKTRGILGEIQLGAILEEILAKEQYETNVITKRGSTAVVEYAVKIPCSDGFVYLPIDSKFPGDTYANLRDAYETGDARQIDEAARLLITNMKLEAKKIQEKYIDPPNTTEYAIMFLPFEGLYAEVVKRGMIEELQNRYKVNLAGPSTMAALLNSIQLSFKTFAIQKRSDQVWELLESVKKEFEKFNDVLTNAQKRMEQTSKELDTLVGIRSRQISKKLEQVSKYSDSLIEEEEEI
ncbi:MAG: DNA recombination protein RmuC [Lachnospiraceae bacterium]